ncbi:MAG: hypothetical protein WA192_02685 [Candidatus Acidiferrales bacterium]
MEVAHFDRRLYEMKLREPSRRMQTETRAAWRRVGHEQQKLGQPKGPGFYAKLIDAALSVLQEYLKDVDRICRDVWEAQGGTVTSQFLRAVVRDYAVFTAMAARCGAIRGEIELRARRTGFRQTTPALRHFALEKRHLQTTLSNRYEIEAREIELKNAHRAPKAPPPTTELGGARPAVAGLFTHSDDYRSVALRGGTHTLTAQQAQMVEILDQAHANGHRDVSIAHILEQLEKKSARWQDTWKSNLEAVEKVGSILDATGRPSSAVN